MKKRKKNEREGDWRMGERGRIRWRKGVKEKGKTRDVDRRYAIIYDSSLKVLPP